RDFDVEYQDLILALGLHTCWATPVMGGDDQVLAVFGVYYHTPRKPTVWDLETIKLAANIAKVAIERHQAVSDILQRDRYLSALVNIQRQLLAVTLDHPLYEAVLARLSTAAGVDRIYLFENHTDAQGELLTSQKAEWCAPGISPELGNPFLQNFSYRNWVPRWLEVLGNNQPITGIVAQFPESEREILKQQQIKAILIIPLTVNGNFFGFIGFDDCSHNRKWSTLEIGLLSSVAAAIALAKERQLSLKALATLNQDLEDRVQQRTADLEASELRLRTLNLELTHSNQRLAAATRHKDEFLANMSHELRTPLTTILGMTESFQSELLGYLDEEQRTAIETIERSGRQLLDLINDILDLAKVEAGYMTLNMMPSNVQHLCQSSVMFVRPQAAKKQLTLQIHVPAGLPDVLVDERRLRQVLINLLINAVKFTPDGGKIILSATLDQLNPEQTQPSANFPSDPAPVIASVASVTATTQPDSPNVSGLNGLVSSQHRIRFTITDTGIGIAPTDQAALFKPFVQIDSALNRQHQGTGLGLALARRLVELHSGQLQVCSAAGQGSQFSFSLPCLAGPNSPNTLPSQLDVPTITTETATESLAAPKNLILLATADATSRLTITSYLKAKGYRLCGTTSPQDLLEHQGQQPPNLLILDSSAPHLDEVSLLRLLRQRPDWQALPIIALVEQGSQIPQTTSVRPSSLGDWSGQQPCRSDTVRANAYLAKPITLKKLEIKIQELLQR
ncbi:MAG: ATP-binding protein, partial [Cyanobacteria bacterium P01_H01_bin.121]